MNSLFLLTFSFLMIKTCFLYLGYALTTAAVTSVSYINLAPQFGSNPSKKEKIEYEKLTNFEDGIFINSESTPLMTGEVSTWDFFKSDSLRKPKSLETEKISDSFFNQLENKDYQNIYSNDIASLIEFKSIFALLLRI